MVKKKKKRRNYPVSTSLIIVITGNFIYIQWNILRVINIIRNYIYFNVTYIQFRILGYSKSL